MAAAADEFAAAHARLVAKGAVQLDLPVPAPPPPPPSWLRDLIEALSHGGPVFKFVFWAGVVVVALILLRLLYPLVRRLLARLGDKTEAPEPGWRPEAAPARQLLDEADALAAAGDFGEAAHLVLLRSVEQIARHRPDALQPALTSRDIVRTAPLPGDVRSAFGVIADIVEAGLFGGRAVGRDAWLACRAAYEGVAFPRAWA